MRDVCLLKKPNEFIKKQKSFRYNKKGNWLQLSHIQIREKKSNIPYHLVHGKILLFISVKQIISSTKLSNWQWSAKTKLNVAKSNCLTGF